ncbi:BamA/TamA family outer membrane protein [Hymenobacter sp. BT175]|uniref:BamA/TamA family outer membrane protein n=1 Tax=Hymenobacter translucens TaxID=2886507 RepID=UPI001D0F196C|nr:BamA/TamA family outer membrane protein [Hymenobacter translucens]MCC2545592.1 BamA/TamA family outer membrane protein [Hymenobacter translucens]
MYARTLVFFWLTLLLPGSPVLVWAQSSPSPPPGPRPAPVSGRPKVIQLVAEAADRAVLRRYRTPASAPDSLTALRNVRDLVLALQADAYLTASADTLRWGRDTLKVGLYVGEQFRWARLRNGNLGDDLLQRAGFREKLFRGAPFQPTEWARLQQRVLAEAENQGYPFATVRLDSVALRSGGVEGRVVLDRGPVIVFDSLELVGRTKTKKRFLTKFLQITPGQPYSQQRVDAAAQLLRQLPYLHLKAEPEVRFSLGRARVYLLVEDRSANQFDAIVGVLPNPNPLAGENKVQLTGDVTINLRNLSGGGKQVGLQWRKTDVASQLLDAHYLHPNFFGTPLELGGSFNLYKEGNDFLTIRPRLQVTYPTARAGRVTFFTERRSSRLLSDTTRYRLQALPDNIDYTYNSYGFDYAWNTLDDAAFPRRGLLVLTQAGIGTKQITKNPEIVDSLYNKVALRSTQISLGGRVEQYFKVGKNGVLFARVRGEALLNERLFLNDLFRVGGLSTLRGFNELEFYASSYAIGTVEFRQFTGSDAYVFLFADQAYLRRSLPQDPFEDLPTGLGAGLSFRTGAGMFQFVYSVGRTREQNFSLNASKIHFGITSRF